jgi:nucleoside-diphosphate-sugar epimerase
MRIVIPGAAGKILSQLVEELRSCYELRLIDIPNGPDRASTIADFKNRSGIASGPGQLKWENAFKGADAVVRLAANTPETASWPEVLGDNRRRTF